VYVGEICMWKNRNIGGRRRRWGRENKRKQEAKKIIFFGFVNHPLIKLEVASVYRSGCLNLKIREITEVNFGLCNFKRLNLSKVRTKFGIF
jgi:hypothetical protein